MTLSEFLGEWRSDSPVVNVRTSGSTGAPKPMLVEKSRMEASARATCQFLGLRQGDTALLCLPMDYIAGKMVAVRAQVWGLRLMETEPSGHPYRGLAEAPVFAALTPMQVFNTLSVPAERRLMEETRQLIIGGGAVSAEMAAQLRSFPHGVWSTYGMTETLSHIAMRRLNGPQASDFYTPLPGVEVRTDEENRLIIDAPAVYAQTLITNDIAQLQTDADGKTGFRILGRKDNVICSGGIKIQAEEAERLLEGRLAVPYMISKKSDPRLGEAVVLVLETGCDINGAAQKDSLRVQAEEACRAALPKYWRPKEIVLLSQLPRTETGKVRRMGSLPFEQ